MVEKAYASTITVFRNGVGYPVRGVKIARTRGSVLASEGANASNAMTIIYNPKFSRCPLGIPFKEEDYIMVGEVSEIGDERLVVASVTEHYRMGVPHHIEVSCG